MGTQITLDIGGMTVSWAKNDRGTDHGFLFQSADKKRIRSEPVDDKGAVADEEGAESEVGFARPLRTVVPRLELLGYTIAAAKVDYDDMAKAYRERDGEETPPDLMSFDEFFAFVKKVAIGDLDNTFVHDLDEKAIRGRFKNEKLKARIPYYSSYDSDAYSERSYFGSLVRFLHPCTQLRLFSENSANLELSLEWQYGPLVSNGWAQEDDFVPNARRSQTYLIATEGSSDTHILTRAFELLRPEIADFFRFIDVKDGHPFSGTGSLVKFAEGLTKIDVHNRTIFLLDNDAEGVSAFRRIVKMVLPMNMRTLTLPALDSFKKFPSSGTDGEHMADINGKAASIECYLDLGVTGSPAPLVRWTNFKEELGVYQGSLEQKEYYCRAFFDRAGRKEPYDMSKLREVLGAIVDVCTTMSTEMLKKDEWSVTSRANALI
jgi:hypothetical protein